MTDHYDIVIIGGGIHGVGVAQAAAAAGHSALLLEQTALAHGTSSRSSKLIHGGLRYLETLQLGLVRESLAERERLLHLAPELVQLVPFYIPVYRHTARRPWQIRAGLSLYALLGGLTPHAQFAHVPPLHWDTLDGLTTTGLQAVFRYFDAQTDDAALTRAVARSAEALGASVRCPAQFSGAQRRADGWLVRFTDSGRETECTAHALVNAAGPWANLVLERIAPRPLPLAVELVQGTHIELDGTLTRGIYYVEARDARAVFAMPWQGRTLVGTTEHVYHGDPGAVHPLAQELEYLGETFRAHFPGRDATVRASFAGLRVLPVGSGRAFHRPRETVLWPDDARAPRLIGIYGGKLTGYRATAQKVLARLRAALPQRTARADTAELPLTPA